MSKINLIQNYRDKVLGAVSNIDFHDIIHAAEALLIARDQGNMVFAFGNGASAACASLFVGELLKSLSYRSEKKFKAVCLNDNIPALSAFANDVSYEQGIVELLKNFIKAGDIVIGISGSGNSTNIVKAFDYANSVGAVTIAVCGFSGGRMKELAKMSLHADVSDMDIVQDVQLILLHSIKRILMDEINNYATVDKKSTVQSVKSIGV